MKLWNLVFFPESGERNSPYDRLNVGDCSPQEKANIISKLKHLQELKQIDWPSKWAKPIEEFKELVHGDFRVFHVLVEDTIVVCHVCRKVGQKAKKRDIRLARANLEGYQERGR